VYVLLEFWQKIKAIPIMNPLSWFMIVKNVWDWLHSIVLCTALYNLSSSFGIMLSYVTSCISLKVNQRRALILDIKKY